MAARFPFTAALAAAALLAPATAAHAAPPSNDLPGAAAPFAPYTAANGVPLEQQAIAELAEATADPGLVRCLGDESFERTVWFFVPAASVAAGGHGGRQRPHARPDRPGGVRPARGDDHARRRQPHRPERVRRPRRRRRLRRGRARQRGDASAFRRTTRSSSRSAAAGAAGAPEDERAVLSLRVAPIATFTPVLGDRAEPLTPVARAKRPTPVPLANATVTADDAATPPCPSLGTVWRRLHPRQRRAAADLRQRRRRLDAGGLHRRHAGRRPRARLRASATRPGGWR